MIIRTCWIITAGLILLGPFLFIGPPAAGDAYGLFLDIVLLVVGLLMMYVEILRWESWKRFRW